MADRYQSDYRSRQDRYQRGSGQAEQFQAPYSDDDDRSYGQMGESWRYQAGEEDIGWNSGQSRYGRERGQQGGAGGYGADYGQSGADRYGPSGYGQSRTARYGNDYQARGGQGAGGSLRGRGSSGSHTSDGPSWDTSSGAGSQLARSHGEWHDRDRDRYGRGSSYGRGGHERGFLERAGEAVASWFEDDDDRERGQSYRGHGPANYKRSDERLLEDACEQLTQDHRVDARNIQVTVQNGEVTLDGTVTSRDQKRRAEDVVENLSGVKHVQNNLRVNEGSTWDRNNSGDRTQSGSTGTSATAATDALSGGTGLAGSTRAP